MLGGISDDDEIKKTNLGQSSICSRSAREKFQTAVPKNISQAVDGLKTLQNLKEGVST